MSNWYNYCMSLKAASHFGTFYFIKTHVLSRIHNIIDVSRDVFSASIRSEISSTLQT